MSAVLILVFGSQVQGFFFGQRLLNFFVPGAVLIGVSTVTFYGTTFCLFFLELDVRVRKGIKQS